MSLIKGNGQILAIDGHDGAGKTSLAKALARTLGAAYVRPYHGAQGARMLSSAEAGDFVGVRTLAETMVQEALRGAMQPVLVFDRLWMTVFTLLPEVMWLDWGSRAPTLLCWADLPTTFRRLGARTEVPQTDMWHAGYLEKYRSIAQRFDVPILDTSRLDEAGALAGALEWAHGVLRA